MSSNDVTITEHEGGNIHATWEQGSIRIPRGLNIPGIVVAALRAHFVAERMPEDVREIVEEVKRLVREGDRRLRFQLAVKGDQAWADQMLDAIQRLEAAYSQKVEPEPEYKLPGYDEVLDKLNELTIRGSDAAR